MTEPLRVLHLLSNRKWTERSEPATDLVVGQRKLGHDAILVCGRWTEPEGCESSVEVQAEKKGLTPIVLNMDKHFRFGNALKDIPELRRIITGRRVDVIHVHLDNAHLLAALALRKLKPRPLLVASSYDVDGPPGGGRANILYRRYTDGVVVLSDHAKRATVQRFSLPPDGVEVAEPGIDLDRFSPDRILEGGRSTFGIPADDFVLGVVSRLRADRRIDIAVDAMKSLAATAPRARLLIVGHGEDEEKLKSRAAELGISDRVTWAGYCRGDKLVQAFRAMDALVYPMPGTDPSCRTVREAMASGITVLASRTGFLASLIDDGATGRFIDVTAASLAAVATELATKPNVLATLKSQSLAAARRRFPLTLQAERTVALYRALM